MNMTKPLQAACVILNRLGGPSSRSRRIRDDKQESARRI